MGCVHTVGCTTFCLTTLAATQAILCSCCEWNCCHIALHRTIIPETKAEGFHIFSKRSIHKSGGKRILKTIPSYPSLSYTNTCLGTCIAHLLNWRHASFFTLPAYHFAGLQVVQYTPFSSLLDTSAWVKDGGTSVSDQHLLVMPLKSCYTSISITIIAACLQDYRHFTI